MNIWVLNLRKISFLVCILLVLVGAIVVFRYVPTVPVLEEAARRRIPIYSVEQDEKRVAITLDAVWGAEQTPGLLELFNEEDIKVTFYLGGYWLEDFPDMARRIAESGHEIGNHLYSHPQPTLLSESELKEELTKTEELIRKHTEKDPDLFRPPFGDYNDQVVEVAEELGYQTIMWNIDSLDWKDLTADRITERIFDQIEPGSIILLHNNGKHTLPALKEVIPRLKEEGYQMVPTGELIYRENYYIDHEGRQRPAVSPEDEDQPEAEESEEAMPAAGGVPFELEGKQFRAVLPDKSQDSLYTRIMRRFRGVKEGVTLEGIPIEGLLAGEVDDLVDAIAAKIERDPRNARYNPQKDEIRPAEDGLWVDVDQTIERIMKAEQGEDLELVIKYIPAEVTADHFKPLYRLPTNDSLMALTVNVAWGEEHLEEMLDILADHDLRVTMFFTGTWVEKFPELTARVAQSGHEIGNHGYRHHHPEDLDMEETKQLIQNNEDLLYETTGEYSPLFAPPYGEITDTTLHAAGNLGYRTVMWTLDTIDWQRPDSSVIYERVMEGKEPGAIVLMHPTAPTVESLERILNDLEEEGYRLGPVSELLAEITKDDPRTFGEEHYD